MSPPPQKIARRSCPLELDARMRRSGVCGASVGVSLGFPPGALSDAASPGFRERWRVPVRRRRFREWGRSDVDGDEPIAYCRLAEVGALPKRVTLFRDLYPQLVRICSLSGYESSKTRHM
jgi:hypothetical protein